MLAGCNSDDCLNFKNDDDLIFQDAYLGIKEWLYPLYLINFFELLKKFKCLTKANVITMINC